jgi:hypothetical protein
MSALVSPDRRVELATRLPQAVGPQLEAVFLGATAASPNLGAATAPLAAAAQLGFAPVEGDTSLTLLPLAFADAASFAAVFPADDTWLARAVRDYFAAGGLRAWVVRVEADVAAPLDAYLAAARAPSGIDVAAQIPSAGLLLLPDLEFLCLQAATPQPPAPPASPVAPAFRPLGDLGDTPAAIAGDVGPGPTPLAPADVLAQVSVALAARRTDMLCLFALPVGADPRQSMAALVSRADSYVHGAAAPGTDLPQVQALAPLLRDADGALASASGQLAGLLCASAQADGVWRSLAGRTLPLGATPVRRVESSALDVLRRSGIVTLRYDAGGTVLDDDILACREARGVPGNAARRAGGTRRLIGWLVRALRSFGEQLVFENVLDDGRVQLVLTDLFDTLHRRGALTGLQLADAVRITQKRAADNAVAFDIEVATAVAVETLRLRFLDGSLTTGIGATG